MVSLIRVGAFVALVIGIKNTSDENESFLKKGFLVARSEGLISKQHEINGSEKVAISRGRHSFPFLCGIRPLRIDSFGIQRPRWPEESLFEQGSIINQSAGQITRDVRAVLTNNPGDPVNECTRTNAFGFDTGHC